MKIRDVLLAAVAGLALCSGSAKATTVTASLTSVDPWACVNLTVNGNAATPTYEGGGVGQLQWTGATWAPGSGPSSFWTYCIQAGPDGDIGLGSQDFIVVSAIQSIADVSNSASPGDVAAKISQMFGAAKATLAPAAAGDLSQLSDANKSGLQLAIWEVIYDGVPAGTVDTTAFSTGNFREYGWWNLPAGTTGVDIENAAVALINNTSADPVALEGLYDPTAPHQNQAILSGSFAPPPVPLPASAATGMALLALNAVWYWKRRRA
jgi:hypothetical protein